MIISREKEDANVPDLNIDRFNDLNLEISVTDTKYKLN